MIKYKETRHKGCGLTKAGYISYLLGFVKVCKVGTGHSWRIKLRMIHPFTWIALLMAIVVGIFWQGIPHVFENMKDLKNHVVWW